MRCTRCRTAEAYAVVGVSLFPSKFIELAPGTALCQNCLNAVIEESEQIIANHRKSAGGQEE